MQFWTCPLCGNNLDFGEKCDCQDEKKKQQEFFDRYLKMEPRERQLAFVFDKGDADRGKVRCGEM